MIARFKLRTGGPRSLTVRGIRYEADRIYTTTKSGMVVFLKGRPEFTFLSIDEDDPKPAPKPSAPKGGPITSAALKTSDTEPADEPEQAPEPKKPAKKKTTKKRTTKKRSTRKK